MDSIIKVSNLTKKFGEFKAVDNISFDIHKKEVFAFLGPNGAGKTTTIKMVTTILNATKGSIKINGFDVIDDKLHVRSSFGIVFQDASLDDDLTAYENMEFHGVLYHVEKELRRKRIKELLEMVELYDRKDDLVKKFSGGMKRRLEIARALLHHPKIIFLDEPTQGLDPQTRNKIWEYIKELNKKEGITVFFTTHYMEEAQKYADRMAIIDHGKIMTIGKVNDIIKKSKTKNLEEAFLKITGTKIRAEDASALDNLRNASRIFRGRK